MTESSLPSKSTGRRWTLRGRMDVGVRVIKGQALSPHGTVEVMPVSEHIVTVRALMEAGNRLADALQALDTDEATIEQLVQAWEAALFAAGKEA